jgi:hypothetical protein
MTSFSYGRGNERWSARAAFRRTVCAALMAVQLAGCTSWRAQPVVPSDLPGFVAAHPSAPLRFTLGNGTEVVVANAHVDGDTVAGLAHGSQVHVALSDIRMVARRRTNVWRTAGLVYAIVGAVTVIGCAATDCFGDWYWQ